MRKGNVRVEAGETAEKAGYDSFRRTHPLFLKVAKLYICRFITILGFNNTFVHIVHQINNIHR